MEQYIQCDLLKHPYCRCYRIKALITAKKMVCKEPPWKHASVGSCGGCRGRSAVSPLLEGSESVCSWAQALPLPCRAPGAAPALKLSLLQQEHKMHSAASETCMITLLLLFDQLSFAWSTTVAFFYLTNSTVGKITNNFTNFRFQKEKKCYFLERWLFLNTSNCIDKNKAPPTKKT